MQIFVKINTYATTALEIFSANVFLLEIDTSLPTINS